MRILFVEDCLHLRDTISVALRKSGYAVDACGDGEEAVFFAENHRYDTMILDIMLPGLDGISLLKRIRSGGDHTPAIMLTARGAKDDRLAGFDAGADDYLAKPFDLDELLARVAALCRRNFQHSSNILRIADLEMNTAAKTVERAGTRISLSPQEFALLELMLRRPGEVISRSQFDEHLYEDDLLPMSNVIDAAIYSLRKKLAVSADSQSLIHTRRGLGYILESPEGQGD